MASERSLIERIQSDEITDDLASEAISLLVARLEQQPDRVLEAAIALLVRVANSWYSVHVLSRHTTNPDRLERVTTDVGALFRISFEAFLQLAYILHEPASRLERATQFLNFEAVERIKLQDKILGNESMLARVLSSSPKRIAGEPALRSAFDSVKKDFVRAKHAEKSAAEITPSRVRDHWYDGNLADLAKEIGYAAEYDFWIAAYHCCIHSSISGCRRGLLMDIQYASYWVSQVVAHSAKICLQYAQLNLSNPHQKWLDAMTDHRLGAIPDSVAEAIISAREAN